MVSEIMSRFFYSKPGAFNFKKLLGFTSFFKDPDFIVTFNKRAAKTAKNPIVA